MYFYITERNSNVTYKLHCKHCDWSCKFLSPSKGVPGSGTSGANKHQLSIRSCSHWLRVQKAHLSTENSSNVNDTTAALDGSQSMSSTMTSLKQKILFQSSNGVLSSPNTLQPQASPDMIRTAINEWIIMDEMPFASVEKDGFKNLIQGQYFI